MKTAIFIIFIFGLCQISVGQDSESKVFDYDHIISDLKSNGKNSEYYPDLDYDALLYLDENSYSILNKIKPKTLLLHKPIKSRKTIEKFEVSLKNITEFFNDQNLLKEITYSLSNESNYEVTNIYIKQPNKGFYTISGTDEYGYYWLNAYGILLRNGDLLVEYVYKLME